VAAALEAMRRLPNQLPPETMKNPHPVEVLLLAVLLVFDAAAVLLTSLVALALTVASVITQPAAQQSPDRVMQPPVLHPLAAVAEMLQALPQRQLMAIAGTRRKLAKAQLVAMVAACS
jgi:hypothetical protein